MNEVSGIIKYNVISSDDPDTTMSINWLDDSRYRALAPDVKQQIFDAISNGSTVRYKYFVAAASNQRVYLPPFNSGTAGAFCGQTCVKTQSYSYDCDWTRLRQFIPLDKPSRTSLSCTIHSALEGQDPREQRIDINITYDGDSIEHSRIGDVPVKHIHIMRETKSPDGTMTVQSDLLDILFSERIGYPVMTDITSHYGKNVQVVKKDHYELTSVK